MNISKSNVFIPIVTIELQQEQSIEEEEEVLVFSRTKKKHEVSKSFCRQTKGRFVSKCVAVNTRISLSCSKFILVVMSYEEVIALGIIVCSD